MVRIAVERPLMSFTRLPLLCCVLFLCCDLHTTALSAPCQLQPSPKGTWEEQYIRRNVQLREDAKTALDPLGRVTLLNALIATIESDDLAKRDPAQVLFALERIQNLGAVEAIPALIHRLNFRGGKLPATLSLQEVFPVYKTLLSFLRRAPRETKSQLMQSLASGEYSEEVNTHILRVLTYPSNPTRNDLYFLFKGYIIEYESQSRRLRTLSAASATSALTTSALPKNLAADTPQAPQSLELNLVRAFELRDILNGTAIPKTEEDRVIKAIQETVSLKDAVLTSLLADSFPQSRIMKVVETPVYLNAATLISLVIDKLDFEPLAVNEQSQTSFPFPATAEGLLSPSITKTASETIFQIGRPALPALLDAVAMRGRSPRFRDNAMALIVQIADGKTEAENLLTQAAQEKQKKAERLSVLVESLPLAN